ncbi:hypothetical protein [Psychrobacter submarinus]|nr:hypothetical protein [Psychrobacter submarinus]
MAQRKDGIVWHTQDSGKSLTIDGLAGQMDTGECHQ